MTVILNVIWLVFGGLLLALGYLVAGILLFIPIITIPFAIASLRIAAFALWPFGRVAVPRANAGTFSLLGNIIWIILAGFWIAIGHIMTGIAMCLTIIGIPLGLANFKMVPISLFPLGYEIRSNRNNLVSSPHFVG